MTFRFWPIAACRDGQSRVSVPTLSQRLEAGFDGRDHTVTAFVFSVIQALIGCTQNGLDGVAVAAGLRYADAHCDHG
jgi:hypothetical protein